ncbi:MAG: MurR/RpiR family transcriptional regulator [Solobacterium sp.]|nr:MurR/RpiR family transcriptional regulator [Solobacterium sp.]
MYINPFETIKSFEKEFTKTDSEIAEFIIHNASDVISYSMADISKKAGVSDAALIRFAKRVGYNGFSALRNDIARYTFSRNAEISELNESGEDTPLRSITRKYAQYIEAIADSTDMETITRIAELYLRSRRVKIVGGNRTFHSVRQLRYRLNKMGFDAEAVEDQTVFSDISHYLGEDDLVILFTTKNNLRYDATVEVLHENKCHIVVFTMIQNLPYKNLCDEVVVLPRISKSDISFLDDQAIYFVFIEVLLDVIASMSREKK